MWRNSEKKHQENNWISQPGSVFDKRQCTAQRLTQAEGENPRIAVIFRGAGKSIGEDENASCHPEVYWQSCV